MKLVATLKMYLFFLFKVPMILWCFPRLNTMDNDGVSVTIPLNFLTKNHLGSMYFGALMVGVDLACGLLAFHLIEQSESRLSLIFKDVHAQFLQRAEGSVRFECLEGALIQDMIQNAISSQERVSMPVPVKGILVKTNECVAEFTITLSIKIRS
ncbi:MAG: DUF4442 domain-containing protein [Actinobacteria bacterium]|nr:DUF4442 domain-containing protein [Actinomycetota bacterium]|tara:strand:- start:313 stop:774 length:462 start_codon:yes stop_codon:yes gene_type:complete